MLDNLGHPDVQVLDGGVAAWTAAGGELTDVVPGYPAARLALRTAWSRVLDRDALAARLRAGDIALIDARAPERYRGDLEPVDPVPGHIPGAISRPTAGNLGPDGRFLDPEVLRVRFDGLGPSIASSCGSGVTACHNALAMRIAGLPDPLLYPGSFSDWATAGMPVATGDDPGAPV
jgi:thiosulfate/3-mercaptopyruvate sulfurtransferase